MAELPLVVAAQEGNLNAVRDCLEAGDAVDACNDGTALWWAAARGYNTIAELLIDWGASLSATRSGYTPLTIAQASGKTDTAALLAAAVQKPKTCPQPERWTALGADTVAFIGHYSPIRKKITHVFNFSARERLVITENLVNRTDTASQPTSFDDLPPAFVEKALDEFEKLGGKTDREYALQGQGSLGKQRKLPQREPGNG